MDDYICIIFEKTYKELLLLLLILMIVGAIYLVKRTGIRKIKNKQMQNQSYKVKNRKDRENLNHKIIKSQIKVGSQHEQKIQKSNQVSWELTSKNYQEVDKITQLKQKQDGGKQESEINIQNIDQDNKSELIKESQEQQILQSSQQVDNIQQKLEEKNSQENIQENIQVEFMENQTTDKENLIQSEQQNLLNSQNQINNAMIQQEEFQDQIDQIKNSMNQNPQLNLQAPPPPEKSNESIVTKLYNLTTQQRHVEAQYKAFVNEELDADELVTEYGMRVGVIKKTLRQWLRGMRKVRGDGNCFYTAFVFQFLQYVISEINDIFIRFIESTKELKFQITYKELQITEEDLELVKNQFIQRCEEIRATNESDRIAKFCQYFRDDNNEYYGQSIIFIRSLTFQICNTEEIRQLFQAQGLDLKQQILEWEYDCESNELIIQTLSQFLNLKTILFFCNTKDKTVEVRQFNQTQNPKLSIYLLFRPGHYCIGLPKDN